jgi:leukotriene-A4 hydrolase
MRTLFRSVVIQTEYSASGGACVKRFRRNPPTPLKPLGSRHLPLAPRRIGNLAFEESVYRYPAPQSSASLLRPTALRSDAMADVEMLQDPCSAANLNSWLVEHTKLNFAVHVEAKKLFGSVDLRIKRLSLENATDHTLPIDLDVHVLDVASVHLIQPDGSLKGLTFQITPFASYGSKLSISGVTSKPGDVVNVRVFCQTTEACPALSWLTPEQTADKAHPFVFSQGQAVLNRSILPCQDSPGRRTTWEASMLVPKPLYIVMSAGMEIDKEKNVPITSDVRMEDALSLYPPSLGITSAGLTEGTAEGLGGLPRIPITAYRKCTANMPQGVAAYLIAFAVGDLRCKQIGHRTRVWSEPSLIEKAAWEFGHNDVTEKYIASLEKLYGAYRWDDYSIVVMPPSFPYGGMENPRATFVTPALLTGDQSLTDVVA